MCEYDYKKIGEFIASLRKQKHLTQNDLAELITASFKTVSKWENGYGFPDLVYQKRLCEELDITLEELHAGQIDKHRRRKKLLFKIRKRITLIVSIILMPIFLFLLIFFFTNFKSLRIIRLEESHEDQINHEINALVIQTVRYQFFYIADINIVDYNPKYTDIIDISLYFEDYLLYNSNDLNNNIFVLKKNNEIDYNNLIMKIAIYRENGNDIILETKLKAKDIYNSLEIKKRLVEIQQVKKATENDIKIIETNLKKAGFVNEGKFWVLNNNDNSTFEINIVPQKIVYIYETESLIERYTYFENTKIITGYKLHKQEKEPTTVERYNYFYNTDTLICQVGDCLSNKKVIKEINKYRYLLNVE